MKIRRKDNHRMIIPLPMDSMRAKHGWLVPIFSEYPDDFFISYLDQDWELVTQENGVPKVSSPSGTGSFLYSIVSRFTIPKNPFLRDTQS